MSQYQKWRGHAEIVLEDYHRNRRWLRDMETNIIYGNKKEPGIPRGSEVSDPTMSAAVHLLNSRIQQVRREVDAVERVQRHLPKYGPLYALMNLVWLERRCKLYQAAELLDMSYRTAIRHKKVICTLLARELGWI